MLGLKLTKLTGRSSSLGRSQRGAPAGASIESARATNGKRRAAGRRKTERSEEKNGASGRGRLAAGERQRAGRQPPAPEGATALPEGAQRPKPKGRDRRERGDEGGRGGGPTA